ncbi:MAG: aminotransferase class IV [Desulfovibrionales bacterium]|nr:aminotransferase class IV [Desulfovibrionales bacterium]
MVNVCETEEYVSKLLNSRRANERDVLAFYEHRIGCICKNPRLMLLPMDDHLAHRGDGVFESIKWENGKIYQLDAHIERMKRSVKGLHLAPPCTWEKLRELSLDVARAAATNDGLLRIIIGRGPGGFGIDPRECPVSSLYIVAYSLHGKPAEWYGKGATAFRSSIPAKPPHMARVKSANYIPNVLMKQEATEKGLDIPFCFDDSDYLAEGATENVALVNREGVLVIPEFSNALIGTTIMRAVELLKDDMRIEFHAVREDDLFKAREVLVFGTTTNCVSIVRFEGQPIGDARPGPVGDTIRELLKKDQEEAGLPL